jgi:hypothetical protein
MVHFVEPQVSCRSEFPRPRSSAPAGAANMSPVAVRFFWGGKPGPRGAPVYGASRPLPTGSTKRTPCAARSALT